MMDFEGYKNQLEKRYNRDMREILHDIYIARDMGPSVGAKHLGIPRQVFLYYRNLYNLKELKHKLAAQNEIGVEQ
ncbi:hypothetical protein ACTL32_00995 [Planococcus sp. FY231025]|uniref:hypothetical protein n=1 Tax=Planococcus sp. FY231025 TaxID=3455699 RepID=UPI003F8EBD2D